MIRRTANSERGTGWAVAWWLAFALSAVPISGAQAQQAAPAIVAIRDFSFEPHEVKIAVGSAVRWVNQDQAPHAVTMEGSRPGSSGELAPGQPHTVTFEQSGTFTYRCAIHPTMLGVLIVGP